MAKSTAYGPPLPAYVRSAYEFLQETVDQYPDKLALASVHQPNDLFGIPSIPLDGDEQSEAPYLRWTFRSLRGAISRLVAGFRAAGIDPGTLIFTFLQNGAEFILAKWAAYELGCILVPLNPRNLDNETELRSMIRTALLACPESDVDTVVVIAGTANISEVVDAMGIFSQAKYRILAGAAATDNNEWTSFDSFMTDRDKDTKHVNGNTNGNGNGHRTSQDQLFTQGGTVLFTSGTTSVPKGVFHRYIGYSHHLEGMKTYPERGGRLPPNSRCCCVLPNNHLLAFYSQWNAYTWGAAWIFPGPVFQPEDMVRTMRRERITHVDLVPTMLYALLGELDDGGPVESLDSVLYAGSVVSSETMRLTTDVLGARAVEALYGMTEGPVIRGGSWDRQELVPVGFAGPGHGFRVADAETNEVLPVGELGELQATGPAVTRSYLGGGGRDSFVDGEDGCRWLKTGDQAKMDSQGRIYITGRYKDMIIRGGENISPTAIETAIRRNPKLALLDPQVVGAPDAIAGEVPVVVVKSPTSSPLSADKRELILTTVADSMGTMYVPADVISLQEHLQLPDYPRTMSGKIQKVKLASLVKKYLQSVETSSDEDSSEASTWGAGGSTAVSSCNAGDQDDLAAVVKDIWARATGQDVSRMSLDTPFSLFADSILMMRVRGKIRMKTGKTLSMAEMNGTGTIAGQIEMLRTKESVLQHVTSSNNNNTTVKRPTEPPTMEDMVHTAQDPRCFEATKELVVRTIAPDGLEWVDVESVFPCSDNFNVFGRIFDWLGINTGILAHKATKAQLKAAIEKTLLNNRILCSFVADFENETQQQKQKQRLHVVMRPNKRVFDTMLEDGGSVKTLEELRSKIPQYPNKKRCRRPGPLTRVLLYDIEETGTGGAILATHHTIVDAFMVQMVCDDVEKALADSRGTLRPHVDFQLWSDSYHSLRSSPEALVSVRWHVENLRNLSSHKDAIWPGLPPDDEEELISEGLGMTRRIFDAPDLTHLRAEHSIKPAMVLKTAQALLNIHRTDASHAVFANYEACRSKFPFLPKSMASEHSKMSDGTDVAGPTFSTVVNALSMPRDETALDLLRRVQAHQEELTKHAAAPAQMIVDALGCRATAELVREMPRYQWFNWSPGVGASIGDPYENIEVLNHNPTLSSARGMGLGVRAGLGGAEGFTYVVIVRTAMCGQEFAERVGADLERITLWLLRRENWDRPVREILEVL